MVVIKNVKTRSMLKKANSQTTSISSKNFYVEISKYRQWLNDEQVSRLVDKKLEEIAAGTRSVEPAEV